MNESATVALILIQLALLLVVLSAVFSAYMLAVIGVDVARRRRLRRSRSAQMPDAAQADHRLRRQPPGAARFYPAPIDAGR